MRATFAKLSDAIRSGLRYCKPASGHFLRRTRQGDVSACAIGAAVYAEVLAGTLTERDPLWFSVEAMEARWCSSDWYESAIALWPVLETEVEVPTGAHVDDWCEAGRGPMMSVLIAVVDQGIYTVPEAAEWVKGIEAEREPGLPALPETVADATVRAFGVDPD